MKKIGIIGAGTMGNGITQVCAVAGLQVVMVDISDAAVERGIEVRFVSPAEIADLTQTGEFALLLHLGAILLAGMHGRLDLSGFAASQS